MCQCIGHRLLHSCIRTFKIQRREHKIIKVPTYIFYRLVEGTRVAPIAREKTIGEFIYAYLFRYWREYALETCRLLEKRKERYRPSLPVFPLNLHLSDCQSHVRRSELPALHNAARIVRASEVRARLPQRRSRSNEPLLPLRLRSKLQYVFSIITSAVYLLALRAPSFPPVSTSPSAASRTSSRANVHRLILNQAAKKLAVTPDIERPIIADVKSVRSVVSTCREGPLLKVNAFVTRRAPRKYTYPPNVYTRVQL